MSCPEHGPSRVMTTVCPAPGCGRRLDFGTPDPRHPGARPLEGPLQAAQVEAPAQHGALEDAKKK